MPDELRAALEAANRAIGFTDRIAVGMDPDTARRIPRRAAVNARIELRQLMPAIAESSGRSVEAVASGLSRCIAAGAHLIILPSSVAVARAGNSIALMEEPGALEVVNPAAFELLTVAGDDPEGEIETLSNPIARAAVDRETLSQFAVRVKVSRRAQKLHGLDRITSQLVEAVAMGLGRVFDKELLRVVDAATLVEVGTAQAVATSAAAAGLRWGDLRAVIGTGAAAGSVAVEHGTLRALGVPGELTADTAKAYVADWRGAGVFVSDAVDLIIDRTSAAGDLVVTAWCGAQGVIADPSRFLEVV